MRFEPYGPFLLPRTNSGMVDRSAPVRRRFWDEIEDEHPGLPGACGCYIFCLKAGRGALPWYIGKAERQRFARECLTSDKVLKYSEITSGRRGKPLLYLLAQVTDSGAFRKPTTAKRLAINALEDILIGMALSRNPKLINVAKTKAHRRLIVPGLVNAKAGRGKSTAWDLQGIFGTG